MGSGGFVIGFVVLAAAVATGGYLLYPRLRQARRSAEQRREEVRQRAEQQHRWAVRGDSRGVYGPDGAALMRAVAPSPVAPSLAQPARPGPPGPDLPVAEVVLTEADLTTLLADRLPNWRYAAFVSVLVQRRAAVGARLRDARMGFYAAGADRTGPALSTHGETGLFFTERLSELSDLIGQIDAFMLSVAFQQVFGDPHDGDSADAEGILHAARRLMDYHDRLLSLSEQCRAVRVPFDCRDLQRDFGLLAAVPLDAFATFIDVFALRVVEMGDVARYATGDVQLDTVELRVTDDNGIVERVSARLQQISGS